MQGIRQAERRVVVDDPVPSREKLLLLFKPPSQVLPRFKVGKPVEFGRKIRRDDVERGIISGYEVLKWGGRQDQPYLTEVLENHKARFGPAPRLLASDRTTVSAEDEGLMK